VIPQGKRSWWTGDNGWQSPPDIGLKWQVRTTPVRAVARFAQRKPPGSHGWSIVLALLVMALLAPVIAPYEPRQIIREAHNRVPVYVPPARPISWALTMSGAISSAVSSMAPVSPCTLGSAPS